MGNQNSGRPSAETLDEAFLSGRHFEAMRIERFAELEAEATDQRPRTKKPRRQEATA